jgi:hypothetical protein
MEIGIQPFLWYFYKPTFVGVGKEYSNEALVRNLLDCRVKPDNDKVNKTASSFA